MKTVLTLLLALFMAVGPVASLSAQIAANIVQQEDTDSHHHDHHKMMTDEDSTKDAHSCCKGDCKCSYANQCDIQQLTFFAIKPQVSVMPTYNPAVLQSFFVSPSYPASSSLIYRPPINTL